MSWHLLSRELIEHQVSQVDLLMAMYPANEEVTLDKESEELLDALRTSSEDGSAPKLCSSPPTISLLLNLALQDAAADDDNDNGNDNDAPDPKTLQLDITVPFSWEGDEAPEEAPRIRVRIPQPPWLNKASTAHLNSQIPDGSGGEDEDLFGTIEFIRETAARRVAESQSQSQARESKSNNSNQAGCNGDGGGDTDLVRVWFYFPSISTRSKRDDFIVNAPFYGLTGFLCAGKPGLLCVEGASREVDEYMKFIKTESWGDIPAHHKKVSERHRERGVAARAFADMREITDSVGERRGQRANRGDMKAMEGWLVERGLGDAFAKVLM